MIEVFSVLFVLSFLYTYLLYPACLFLISAKKSKNFKQEGKQDYPYISFIVPFFNEEASIKEKVENCLAISYPRDKVQFVFVSDASTDQSNEIVSSFSDVELIVLNERVGKEKALQEAITQARGELFCISDVATSLPVESLEAVAQSFQEPSLGVVSSCDDMDKDKLSLDTLHVRFEMFVRNLESRVSSIVGVSGSCFVARSELCRLLTHEHSCSDLEIAFIAVREGYRVEHNEKLVGKYRKTKTAKNEFNRQVRIITHGMITLINNRYILNPFKYGIYSWQVFSHKVIRWLSPLLALMLSTSILSAILKSDYAYPLLVPSIGLLLVAMIMQKKVSLLSSLWQLFGMVMIYLFSVLFALVNVLTGTTKEIWSPTVR